MNPEAHILMYTHKIEKALSMPNRYPVFAQDIAKELITLCQVHTDVSSDIIGSAYYTLTKYCDSLDLSYPKNQIIVMWLNLYLPKTLYENSKPRELTENHYPFLKELALNRHSTRNFLTTGVPLELIEKAVGIAGSLPSACNRQPATLTVVSNPEIKADLLSLHCGNKGFTAPVLGAIVVNSSALTQEFEGNSIYFHGGLFAAGLTLGLESLGLGSVLLNWHVAPETNQQAKDLLGFTDKEITSLIFIGYPDRSKLEAYSYKKNSSNLIEFVK